MPTNSYTVHYPQRVPGSPWWFDLACGQGGRGPLCPTDGFAIDDDPARITCKACKRTRAYKEKRGAASCP